MSHWCRDIPRDEAVRAAEDGRSGPLPTLEECIERVTERRPVQPGGGGNVTGGLRTERVTLEVTHFGPESVAGWEWKYHIRPRHIFESVRVVKETHFDDLAQVAMQRDAAIREREELKARVDYLERDRKFWCLQSGAHEQATNVLRARVAELEAAAKLAPAANADGGSNHAAPAASGAAGTEANG